MAKFSHLFMRKDPEDGAAAIASASLVAADAAATEVESEDAISARLGESCEALRNLIIEAGCKANDLEEAKQAFFKIVDPAEQALRTLEQEKARAVSLTRRLGLLRQDRAVQQARFDEVAKRAEGLAADKDRLRLQLEETQRAVRELKSLNEELTDQAALGRIVTADLERQVAELSARAKSLTDDNQKYRSEAGEAETTIGALEADLAAARESLAILEGENRSLQSSLGQGAAEFSNLSQRNAQTETALSAAQARIQQLETTLARLESERDRLVTERDALSERERSAQTRAHVQVEAVQARAAMAEKLLANTRQLLATRNEEARAFEREVIEAKRARSAAETLRGEIEALVKTHESQIEELEHSRAALTERNASLTDSLKYREAQLAQAEEEERAAASEIARLDNDLRTSRMVYEKRIDELLAMLERERLNRQVVEGALDTTRSERAQLQHEVYKLRRAAQRSGLADETSEPPTRGQGRPSRSADAA